MWSRFSFAGAVTQTAVGMLGLSFWAVLGQEDILAVVSDETLRALNAFDTIIFFSIMNWPQAIFLLGASVVIIQSGVMPKWIGWLGGVLAVLGPISSLWIFSGDNEGFLGGVVGTVSFLGFQVWMLATAITMIRSSDTAATA